MTSRPLRGAVGQTLRLLLGVLIVLVLAAPAFGKAASFADVEDEVMCVSCNVALNVADSPQADAERKYIRDLIAKGYDKEQVKHALVDVYGDNVLALPKSEGINWVAYLVPIALVASLAVALGFGLRRWRRREPDPADVQAQELSDADAARLDADLATFDR
jgi:cytochrome c-type biogenesis protein CcmH